MPCDSSAAPEATMQGSAGSDGAQHAATVTATAIAPADKRQRTASNMISPVARRQNHRDEGDFMPQTGGAAAI
ncbi:hypothetical protein MOKP120_36460 [Mycobacterium avium subsp. hominissuis]